MLRLFEMQEGNVKVISVVNGTFGSIPLKMCDFLDELGIPCQLGVIQKSTLLETAHMCLSELLLI